MHRKVGFIEKSTCQSGLLIRMLEKSNEKPIESAEKKNPS